jgi:hypothetical protein
LIAVDLGDKAIAISLPLKEYERVASQAAGPYVFRGVLKDFTAAEASDLETIFLQDGITKSQLDSILYKKYLDYQTPLESVLIYIIIAAGILIFIAAAFLPPFIRNRKAFKSLKNYSNSDLQMAYNRIDNEAAMPGVFTRGPITITQNYVIAQSRQIVFALPISELMWVYKKVITNKTYGITVGKTNSLVFVFSNKRTFNVEIAKKDAEAIDDVLAYFAQNCPTVFVGFSQERANMLQKNSSEFIRLWKSNVNPSIYQ